MSRRKGYNIVSSRSKTVYVFDFEGNPVGQYESVSICASRMKINKSAVSTCIKRGNCYNYTYYFSHNEKFKPAIFPSQHTVFSSKVSCSSPEYRNAHYTFMDNEY